MEDNLSCIYWFSGTGNSLYTAKILSFELGGYKLVKITDNAPTGAVGGAGARIGFVFPSYYGNLPRAVHAFVHKMNIKPDTYVFAVVTMGAVGQGSVGAMDKLLKSKGLRLNYGKCVLMPANYVIGYNPADGDKKAKMLDKADARIRMFANEISSGAQSVKSLPVTGGNLYKDIEKLDDLFIVGDGCSGCGLCETICPVRNIRLADGKPHWLHHCEQCVACISWCPAKAINYSNKTQNRRRYRNPRINADDFIENN